MLVFYKNVVKHGPSLKDQRVALVLLNAHVWPFTNYEIKKGAFTF